MTTRREGRKSRITVPPFPLLLALLGSILFSAPTLTHSSTRADSADLGFSFRRFFPQQSRRINGERSALSVFPTANSMAQGAASPLVYVYGHADFATSDGGSLAAVGDFNGDGWLDFVTISSQNNSVSILLSQPDGSFKDTGVSYPVAAPPTGVAVSDFNGDGKLDLVVPDAVCPLNSTCPSGLISVLIGNGDGTFQPHRDYATGHGCGGTPAVGDFNGDAKLDLALACELQSGFTGSPGIVSLLLGNGDGTFQPHLDFAASTGVIGVVAGDFNNDGKLDLLVQNAPALSSHTVSLFLGKGNGTFLPTTTVDVGGRPLGVTVADLNGDGRLDLAVASAGETITVLLGNGDGTFQPPASYATGFGASYVAVSDMNGDGKVDLVVAYERGVSILLGNGDGTFKPHVDYVGAGAFAVGDFNRDGKLDVAGGSVGITLGNGDGTLANPVDYATGNGPSSVITGDFNSDGKLDLAVANFNDNTVSILLGQGNGKFGARTDYATGAGPTCLVTGDFNGDGKLDLAVVDRGDNSISILLGNGDGTFNPAVKFATGALPEQVVAGDFNLDGKLDLAVTNGADNTVSILLGNGDGAFQPHVDYATGTAPLGVVAGDLNGDGKLDLAVADSGTPSPPPPVPGLVSILLGNGDGTFQAHTDVPLGVALIPTYLALGDLNGDGKADLGVMTEIPDPDGLAGLTVLLGNGDGTFQVKQGYPGLPASIPTAIIASDFNATGRLGVAVSSLGNSMVNLFDGLGDGTFRSQGTYGTATGSLAQGAAVGDFDGDGYTDMAVAYSGSNTLSVYLSARTSSPPDFVLASSDTLASITAGQTATYTLKAAAINSFNGTVSFACAGAPAQATCSVSPGSVTLNGSGTASTSVSVATTSRALSVPGDLKSFQGGWPSRGANTLFGAALALVILSFLCAWRLSPDRAAVEGVPIARIGLAGDISILVLVLIMVMPSCGGGSTTGPGPGSGGTPPGTYNLTVTATSASGSTNLQHSLALTLTVR